MSLAIYPGSFDPLTNGHLDVALRAARLFDQLVLGVYEGSNKPGALFTIPERVELARIAIAESADTYADRIHVERFSGLAVTYAREKGAIAIVRGLRAVSDFEYEFQYAHMNEHLAPEIEVVSLMTSSSTSFISSSFIREVSMLGGSLEGLVPDNVARALNRLRIKRQHEAAVLTKDTI
ncbi:MAG: pantetheine-phosphate adenylyltransferase [Thermomicrobiales bacterium]|nr:pantetheine-phosphate adenylyltransferase [Thermomicrobiales bacterium]MCO5217653.1 pantetheine-phosphate adenylyltransferase [Thermomicrobiales bacterium]MCO5224044.1 pantetheine-phosphate adenylyltransferase [Thermomicrobiales bacterium]MCO5228162.1 pantetheine-phosphate adenylyltransferase [Thermomicrobiales bacterium]